MRAIRRALYLFLAVGLLCGAPPLRAQASGTKPGATQQPSAPQSPASASKTGAAASSPRKTTITLLGTTDSHGHLDAWDYLTDKPVPFGLTKIATLVKQQRAEAPHALLLDCGDTSQGTPISYYYFKEEPAKPNPAMAVFNAMHYDAMAVGNHEFNFGLESMWKAKREAHFPWLAANLKELYTAGPGYIAPYVVRVVDGVRIGIVGFVTPGVPRWEPPEHYRGYEFLPIVETAKRVIPEVRSKVDLVVVIMHSGLDRDPKTGELFASARTREENAAWELADEVPGIDVIFYGHSHMEMPELMVHGVLMTQAKNWGSSLARADVEMARDAEGHWSVTGKHSRVIPATDSVAEDPAIAKIVAPFHAATEKYLNLPVGESERTLDGTTERYVDGPLVDFIHKVQLDAGHADVSVATMFYPDAHIPAGRVTMREVSALYLYDNLLYTVEMNGTQIKDVLEHAASFFSGWPLAQGQKERLPGYNADSAEGVSYTIDLTQPAGARIRDLSYKGTALDPAQQLRVAVNSFQYSGGGEYTMFNGLPILEQSKREIRELVVDYLTRTKKIPAEADNNWKIEPQDALDAILKAAADESSANLKR